jgi:hypothetical protein
MSIEGGRRALVDAALVVVTQAADSGGSLRLIFTAQRLLRENPGCGVSLLEIEQEVLRLAMQHGVKLVLSDDMDEALD